MASFSAQLTSQDVGMCWHMLPFCLQPSPPFTRAMALCHVRGCGAERDTLDKSRHKPGQQGQLPNPRSISLGTLWLAKCAAQLPSLNLLNRLCLSNSDADVQSVGYNSAQSPTNWQLFHGKDPSILCWLSSRLSIALWWKPKRRNPSFCIDKKKLITIFMQYVCVKFGELPINTLQVLRDQGSCLSKILNMRCSSLILMPEFHLCQVTSPHIQYCIILILMKPLVSGFVWLVKCPNQCTKNIFDAYVCKWYNSDVALMTKIK